MNTLAMNILARRNHSSDRPRVRGRRNHLMASSSKTLCEPCNGKVGRWDEALRDFALAVAQVRSSFKTARIVRPIALGVRRSFHHARSATTSV